MSSLGFLKILANLSLKSFLNIGLSEPKVSYRLVSYKKNMHNFSVSNFILFFNLIESVVEKSLPNQKGHPTQEEMTTEDDNVKPTSATVPLTNPGNFPNVFQYPSCAKC